MGKSRILSVTPSRSLSDATREPSVPLTLHTLGPVRLGGGDAEACRRVLAQPKRLAVLVFLAARPRGEGVPRDRIVGTFWPELVEERARASLRTTLHFLRGTLGEEILSSGKASIAIDSKALLCDAALLLSPPEDTGPAMALLGKPEATSPELGSPLLDLYRGEFLDAMYVRGAPDFERWVDRRRAELRARASRMAWELAARFERAEEWISATTYARRAVELSVDTEGASQRLIRLLDRAGDRAAALAEFARLRGWLATEFEIEPSPETVALMDGIRARQSPTRVPTGPLGEGRPAGGRALAVLPFEDLTPGASQYLASGVWEDVLTALSRLQGVRVISRTSVRRFTPDSTATLGEIRELLGVDLLLQGSVQAQEGRVRITAQLIDATRDGQLWAESYDRELSDIFSIQSDVALRVARALEAALSPREHERLRRRPTTSTQAWKLYLKGREIWRNRDPKDASRAIALFEEAVASDGSFGQAWVGLADAHMVRAAFGTASVADIVATAGEALGRALDIDPDLGEAHATLGLFHTFLTPDLAAAGRHGRRAVELSPSYATGRQWYGNHLCAMGVGEDGPAELALAVELDPLAPAVRDSFGLGLYHLGRLDEAEHQFRRTLALDPEFWRSHISLAFCGAARGDLTQTAEGLAAAWKGGAYGATTADADAVTRALRAGPEALLETVVDAARSKAETVPSLGALEALLLAVLGAQGPAIDALERIRERGTLGLVVLYAPALDPLATSSRFADLMSGAGLFLPRWG